jgi:hypothetical protein
MKYVIFSGCSDYSADTRNANGSIDLWPIQFSDYSAAVNDRRSRLFSAWRTTTESSILRKEAGSSVI